MRTPALTQPRTQPRVKPRARAPGDSGRGVRRPTPWVPSGAARRPARQPLRAARRRALHRPGPPLGCTPIAPAPRASALSVPGHAEAQEMRCGRGGGRAPAPEPPPPRPRAPTERPSRARRRAGSHPPRAGWRCARAPPRAPPQGALGAAAPPAERGEWLQRSRTAPTPTRTAPITLSPGAPARSTRDPATATARRFGSHSVRAQLPRGGRCARNGSKNARGAHQSVEVGTALLARGDAQRARLGAGGGLREVLACDGEGRGAALARVDPQLRSVRRSVTDG